MILYKNYSELPIAIYEKLSAITADDYADESDRNIDIMAVMTGKTAEELLKLSIVEFRAEADKLTWLYDKVEPSKPKKSYRIGGRTCVVEARPDKVSWAQYIDFKNYMADPEAHITELASLFLIPKGCAFNEGYDLAQFHEEVRSELPITDALGLLAFFFAKLERSRLNTLYSSLAMMKMAKPSKEMKECIEALRREIRSCASSALTSLRRMSLRPPLLPKM